MSPTLQLRRQRKWALLSAEFHLGQTPGKVKEEFWRTSIVKTPNITFNLQGLLLPWWNGSGGVVQIQESLTKTELEKNRHPNEWLNETKWIADALYEALSIPRRGREE